MIKNIKNFIVNNNLDGYIIPKNDIYFTEYSNINNLSKVTKFTGSAGFALILKKKNYLFVDGRYTAQAKKQSGREFKICEIPYIWPKHITKKNLLKIGFDPKLFTERNLINYFDNETILVPIVFNFKKTKQKKLKKFYILNKNVTGESYNSKLRKINKHLVKKKIDYLYVSASENVCWLLNVRGKDLPNSPLANCKLLISKKKGLSLFTNLSKISNIRNFFKKKINFYPEEDFPKIFLKLKYGKICIDENTCSIFEKKLIESVLDIKSSVDPIYRLKSIKNRVEIRNTINCHITDGVALTKFLFWFKNLKKVTTERQIDQKLEKFRKNSKKYLYPSFDAIVGSGPNGAIIHYRYNSRTNRKLLKNDILLIDSGGQYKWGTTDVTRTVCNGSVSKKIKDNFTRVLKGHIAVATCNIAKYYNGYLIDKLARKSLRDVNLDYSHGTGHGVGFFLNVHEGPQGITKYNKIPLENGMFLSNEPGYYLNNHYGIRIENLIYVKKEKEKLKFENLTYAPIDLDMVNFKLLKKKEKKYLFDYHLNVYSKISQYLNVNEKKWLLNLIK